MYVLSINKNHVLLQIFLTIFFLQTNPNYSGYPLLRGIFRERLVVSSDQLDFAALII